MKEFKTYHPLVNFIYFLFVVVFSCVYMHPVCLGISFLTGFTYSVMTSGRRAFIRRLAYILPLMLAAALINPAFNHEGVTILTYLPSGNPLTLESILYGLAAAVMLASVICHFSCYNEIMTSDKFIYLFGRILPSLSLILSMVLRFVPTFKAQLQAVVTAQRGIGMDVSSGTLRQRAKKGIGILSVMVTRSLENAVETADSMRSRGYGLPGRTAFSNFVLDRRDIAALLWILLLGAYVLAGGVAGSISYRYFPATGGEVTAYGISVLAAYFMLCITPILIEGREERRWRLSRRKI